MEVTFANPIFLWFFMVVPAILVVHFISLRAIKRKAILFANYEAMEKVFGKKILSKNYPLLAIRVLTLIFLIFAIIGTTLIYEDFGSDSDFTLAIDASASMLAQDYLPDRLYAAKGAAQTFVDSVPSGTRIGVISFAGASFVQVELTDDIDLAGEAVDGVDIEIAGGTAIGEAIVSSVNMVISSERNKVIILLTDGRNNVGVTIAEALAYAKRFDVVIHTIGIGTEEGGMVGNTSFAVGLDAETLQLIADETGGVFYRAMSEEELKSAYETIATTAMRQQSMDLTSYLMLIAMALFVLELILVNSKYRTLP